MLFFFQMQWKDEHMLLDMGYTLDVYVNTVV